MGHRRGSLACNQNAAPAASAVAETRVSIDVRLICGATCVAPGVYAPVAGSQLAASHERVSRHRRRPSDGADVTPPAYNAAMNRTLIVIGIVVIAVGVLWKPLSALPLFRLPGDFVIDRPGFKFFFPLTSMILISAVVSLILWLFRR